MGWWRPRGCHKDIGWTFLVVKLPKAVMFCFLCSLRFHAASSSSTDPTPSCAGFLSPLQGFSFSWQRNVLHAFTHSMLCRGCKSPYHHKTSRDHQKDEMKQDLEQLGEESVSNTLQQGVGKERVWASLASARASLGKTWHGSPEQFSVCQRRIWSLAPAHSRGAEELWILSKTSKSSNWNRTSFLVSVLITRAEGKNNNKKKNLDSMTVRFFILSFLLSVSFFFFLFLFKKNKPVICE